MDLNSLFKQLGKSTADHAPAILTAVGVAGTLTTAYLSAKAAFKSAQVLGEAEEEKAKQKQETPSEETEEQVETGLTTREKFDLTWKYYTPAAVSALMTVSAIVLSNRAADKRIATLASAYSVAEKSLQEYRKKTLDKVGKNKEQAIRDEINQDHVTANPLNKSILIVTGRGETLCLDKWSGRYFTGDLESIRKAVNDLNLQIINENYASLSDFYDLIGLETTGHSDDFGWNTDAPVELEYSAALTEDSQPCIVIEFKRDPAPRYMDFH